jgi:hypothetical protein
VGGNYDIVLIEEVEVENRDQLRQRERHYIETLDCVNLVIPYRTEEEHKQWRTDNKDRLKELWTKWYAENKNRLAETVTCPCGAIVSKRHLEEHETTDKHRSALNITEPLDETIVAKKTVEQKRLQDLYQKSRENKDWVENRQQYGRNYYHENKDKYKQRIEAIKNDPESLARLREYKKLKAREYREKKKQSNA